MNRRNFTKTLLGVLGLGTTVKGQDLLSDGDFTIPVSESDTGQITNERYQYYFGALRSGKTTRLVNDAVSWLEENPGSTGLFVVSNYWNTQHIKNIIESNRNLYFNYNKQHNVYAFNNRSELHLAVAANYAAYYSVRYQGLWTDTIHGREVYFNWLIGGHQQHVITTEEYIDLERSHHVAIKPVNLTCVNDVLNKGAEMWGWNPLAREFYSGTRDLFYFGTTTNQYIGITR